MRSRRVIRPRVTWADYQQLPDDGRRYEVLEGELVVTPAPGYPHQKASMNISYRMEGWRLSRGDAGRVLCAPYDVILAEDTIVQPDIVYLSGTTLDHIHDDRLFGAPDVAVEIHNQRSASRDRISKLQIYATYRVKEYWLVDLEGRSITVLRLAGDGYETIASGTGETPLASEVMEGFFITPREAFAEI